MKFVVKTKNIKLDLPLRNFIEEKFNQLDKFSPKDKPNIGAWAEIGKTTGHHQKGPFYFAECQMRFPGKSLRAESKSYNLQLAITEVKDELQRQLKQYKTEKEAKSKRRQRVVKKELKLSPAARFYRRGRIREEGI